VALAITEARKEATMSLKTWKAEFYPKPAHETTKEEAVAHSLQKWIGLRPENLARHNVLVDGDKCVVPVDDEDDDWVNINGETCALCHHNHENDEDDEGGWDNDCGTCPLKVARGGVTCDNEIRGDEPDSPWHHYSTTRDPEPMIFWLQKAAEEQQRANL
jgi:hypothetical protein